MAENQVHTIFPSAMAGTQWSKVIPNIERLVPAPPAVHIPLDD
jgi:hypothetical protein